VQHARHTLYSGTVLPRAIFLKKKTNPGVVYYFLNKNQRPLGCLKKK
jgi:hypothetical protein